MPATGAMSARIDIAARLRIFDFDGSMDRLSRDVWDLLEARHPLGLRSLLAAMAALLRR
jgi:hypothetical protein